MNNIYDVNGIPFWIEKEIDLRNFFIDIFAKTIREELLKTNSAWQMTRIEAPLLTPQDVINPNYTAIDTWVQEGHQERKLVLRPETTPGSYAYAQHLLKSASIKPPFVIWQAGKSFRREQDQVSKNVRLKEFYQQEFQCVFTADTFNDYHEKMLEPIRLMLQTAIGLPTRIIKSDRLPDYSIKTMDVEVDKFGSWMEVCSISLRKDFPSKFILIKKDGSIEKDLLVLEIAIGLDRCVYQYFQKIEEAPNA